MHKAKTPKLLISILAVISLVFGGVIGVAGPANAVAACNGVSTPGLELISDPVFYTGLSTYDANYIGYKVTTPSGWSASPLWVKLSSFNGTRVSLALKQSDKQSLGTFTGAQTGYTYFLAKAANDTETTPQTHLATIYNGDPASATALCEITTSLNPSAASPAAASNNSNKVDSVGVSGTATNVGDTVTVTVKGRTGTLGGSGRLSFAPISNSSFTADEWSLVSSTVKLKQTSSWADQGSTVTLANKLYWSGQNANDGYYTATYVFKMIATATVAAQLKPIQYAESGSGLVYTGTMPSVQTSLQTATLAAGATYTVSFQKTVGGVGSSATGTFTNLTQATAGASVSLPTNPSLSGYTFGGWSEIDGDTVAVSNTYTPTGDATLYAIWTALTPSITPSTQSRSTTVNTAISASTAFTATNFTGAVTYTVAPPLPAGLSINSTNGVISGTPSVVQASADYTITATGATSGSDTAIVSIAVTAAAATPAPVLDRKVTICHRTHSVTNPYVRITVDYNSVNKKSGHQGHDEIFAGQHVYTAGIYKRAKDKDWGDIIPADPTGFNRWQPLNWTTLGAQIYNGTVDGCPAYDAVKYYNALREAGVPEKKIKQEIADLETEQEEAKPEVKKTNITELKYTGSDSKITEDDGDKVTICHRTNSETNPYVRITVAASSIYKNAGHYGHDEIYAGHHVFDSTVAYPNNKKDWGDIIPADPTGKNRWAALNMTTLGTKIYNGDVEGCAEKSLQTLYNELREEGKSKKEIVKELESQKNLDEDPKDLDELEYTGKDPEVEKTEPKEPSDPNGPNSLNPVKIPDQSLSGIVWLDLNKDGLKDANEPLMKNIRLFVVQVSSIPAPVTPSNILVNAVMSRANVKAADAPVRAAAVYEVLTDANGFYLFPSLGAGDWKVTTTVPDELYVTYDSHESSDGEIVTTVPVSSHAFTWVGLVNEDETKTLEILKEILKDNPNALPLAEVPPALQPLVVKARIAAAAASKPTTPANTATPELAETGTSDLAWFYFGILLLLTGVALRLARTKR